MEKCSQCGDTGLYRVGFTIYGCQRCFSRGKRIDLGPNDKGLSTKALDCPYCREDFPPPHSHMRGRNIGWALKGVLARAKPT